MSRTILIVDDNSIERQKLEKLLAAAGYVTTTAADGAQALEIARRTKPDGILMDVNMPQMDGYAATRALKADDATKGIPVVMVTGKAQPADIAWSKMLGASGHVAKPYTDDDILKQLGAL